jgi:S-adenosylmethionine-dependent methyltransferase
MGGDSWAGLADQFVDGYSSLFGQVRLHVVDQHLRAHLPPPPAALIDIGGGAGTQSIPLARDGYTLTILDPSPAMLAKAAARLKTEDPAVAARTSLIEAPGEQALECVGDARYTGVLCHGVLMYLDDPAPMVTSLCRLAEPGGIVSIVTKNAKTLAMRPAVDHNWEATLAAFEADHQVNGLHQLTRADTVDAVTGLLQDNRCHIVGWYGVRLFTEGWGRAQPHVEPDAAVLTAELEASRRDPYRQLSRLFHLLAQRS